MFNILVSQLRSNLINEAHFNKNMRFSGGLFYTMLLSQRLSGVSASNQCFKFISLLAEQPMLPPVKVVNIAKIIYIYLSIYLQYLSSKALKITKLPTTRTIK